MKHKYLPLAFRTDDLTIYADWSWFAIVQVLKCYSTTVINWSTFLL